MQGYAVNHFFNCHLPEGCQVYTGHFRLQDNATVDDHREAKRKLLRCVNGHTKRHGVTIEVRATLHVTALNAAHYDYILYSDMPLKPLRSLLRHWWIDRAHGKGYSFQVARKVKSAVNYVSKSRDDWEDLAAQQSEPIIDFSREASNIGYTGFTTPGTTRNDPETPPGDHEKKSTFIPAHNGLNVTWHSGNFFQGSNLETLWKALIAIWYPPKTAPKTDETAPRTPQTAPQSYDPDAVDRRILASKLPNTPEGAMTIDEINVRFSLAGFIRTGELLSMIAGTEAIAGKFVDDYGNRVAGYWLRRPWDDSPSAPHSRTIGPVHDDKDNSDTTL